MKNKKGVTEPTLIIGVLIIAATIFILGTTRVLVPLIKTEIEFVATDANFFISTAYAAPENLNITISEKISGAAPSISIEKANNVKKICANSGNKNKCTDIVIDKSAAVAFKDTKISGIGDATYFSGGDIVKFRIQKYFDKLSRKNKITFSGK